ncbi:hypothetical protein CDAR_461491 [Caerostris darwini]|uniref:Uncharacterized protein n=1 Tax=Caerostris darwini TaxID=1538125 RepID=A0AAV4M779_9ARAC|nr:hypothetical protein CDAR_461491 [Caerostris darwini]
MVSSSQNKRMFLGGFDCDHSYCEWSSPGCTSEIRSKGQMAGGRLVMMTRFGLGEASSTLFFAAKNINTHSATFSKSPSGCFEQVAIEFDGVAHRLPVHLEGNLTFCLSKMRGVKAYNDSISLSDETKCLELRITLSWHRSVLSFLNVNLLSPMNLFI